MSPAQVTEHTGQGFDCRDSTGIYLLPWQHEVTRNSKYSCLEGSHRHISRLRPWRSADDLKVIDQDEEDIIVVRWL